VRWISLVVCMVGCRIHFDELTSDPEVDAAPATVDAASVTCPPTYTVAATGCYRWSTPAVSTNPAAAASACAADGQGAHLAVISSVEENQVLTALQGATTSWIGLAMPSDVFVWVTGEMPVFSRWAPGDPNGEGNCARLLQTVGDWDDDPCTKNQAYLCEIDGLSATVVPPAA